MLTRGVCLTAGRYTSLPSSSSCKYKLAANENKINTVYYNLYLLSWLDCGGPPKEK